MHAVLYDSVYAHGKRQHLNKRAWLADISFYVIDFMLGERSLAATPYWNHQPNLIAPYVGQCLLNLRANDHRLIISPYSGPDHARRIRRRKRWLNAQQALYFDYVLSGGAIDVAWLTYQADDTQMGAILVEPPVEAVSQVVQEFFEWHSFEGYLIRQDSDASLVELLPPITRGHIASEKDISWKRALRRHLDLASIYFEEWADACALRLWTVSMSREEIVRRLRLDEINSMLSHVELPTITAAPMT